MKKQELRGQLVSGKMSRRRFNKYLTSLGLTLVSLPLISRPATAAPKDHPVIFTWEG